MHGGTIFCHSPVTIILQFSMTLQEKGLKIFPFNHRHDDSGNEKDRLPGGI